MPELENTNQEPPFKTPYLVRLLLGLSSAFLILFGVLMAEATGSAFRLLTLLGGATLFASYAVDPWPLIDRLSSHKPTPRGPHAALARRLEFFGFLLILSGCAWRMFAS